MLLRHLFQSSDSRFTGRFISGDEGHGSRQRPGYLVTPIFRCHAPCTPEINRVQFKKCLRLGEASGIRRDTDGDHQKKAYEKQIISGSSGSSKRQPAIIKSESGQNQSGFAPEESET
ncbi:MAG: hypothetical protein PHY43_04655 [Verrucomicrobiales bacterium]|nr:hypothetical protein [Verrucomicrobiales bacterium]